MRIVPVDRSPGGPFPPEGRAIFALGGGLDLWADPLAVERRHGAAMGAANPDALASWLRQKDHNRQLLAFRRLVPIAHAALGTAPIDAATGAGLTGDEALRALDRFFAFRDAVRAEHRLDAEMLATYPGLDAGAMTYRRYCGLAWNLARAQALPGAAHYRAAVAAAGGPLDFTLADAMAGSLDEARRIAERFEDDRLEAQARADFRANRG